MEASSTWRWARARCRSGWSRAAGGRRRGRRPAAGPASRSSSCSPSCVGAGWVLTPSVDDAPKQVAAFLAAARLPGVARSGALPAARQALIATEDSRFDTHPGVDPISLLRAPLDAASPARTRAARPWSSSWPRTSTRTATTAVCSRSPRRLPRPQARPRASARTRSCGIYLDDGYYGHGFYGLTAATKGYFGVAPGQLTWAQATLLAGLFQAPTAYDPLVHPDAARPGRRTCSTGWSPSARSRGRRPTPSPRSRGGCAAAADRR